MRSGRPAQVAGRIQSVVPSNSLANYLSARDYFKATEDAAIEGTVGSIGQRAVCKFAMETYLGAAELLDSVGLPLMAHHRMSAWRNLLRIGEPERNRARHSKVAKSSTEFR